LGAKPDQLRRQATAIFLGLDQGFSDCIAGFGRSQNLDQREPAVAIPNPDEAQGFFRLRQGGLGQSLYTSLGGEKAAARLGYFEFEIRAGDSLACGGRAEAGLGSGDVTLIAIAERKGNRDATRKA